MYVCMCVCARVRARVQVDLLYFRMSAAREGGRVN